MKHSRTPHTASLGAKFRHSLYSSVIQSKDSSSKFNTSNSTRGELEIASEVGPAEGESPSELERLEIEYQSSSLTSSTISSGVKSYGSQTI